MLATKHPKDAESLWEGHSGLHLVLRDLILPGTTGRKLARRIHALRPESKVLYMSGYMDDGLIPRHGFGSDVGPLPGRWVMGQFPIIRLTRS